MSEDGSMVMRKVEWILDMIRGLYTGLIGQIVCMMCMYRSISSFQSYQGKQVEEGTNLVLELQKLLRCRVLDIYFGIISFCAEEEFYLILLPIIIWNFDIILGYRLTIVISAGLFVGNTLKDIFCLPRPKSPPVWRPSHQESIDSTNLQDFGFPSTHSMNALSNSLFIFLYLCSETVTYKIDFEDKRVLVGLFACFVYVSSMCAARLYLGAHTPTDIRGGLALGCFIIFVYFPVSVSLEMYYMTDPNIYMKMAVISTVLLLINPLPCPITPTYHQNGLLLGLLCGVVIGGRWNYEMERTDNCIAAHVATYITNADPAISLRHMVLRFVNRPMAILLRNVLGYSLVMILRIIAKGLMGSVLSGFFGIPTKPKKTEHRDGRIRLLTRDMENLGIAIVKVFTYMVLAWAITYFVPVCLQAIGL